MGGKCRLRAYRDPKHWGRSFVEAAHRKKMFCSMFTQPRAVHNGVAFVRVDQQAAQREISIGVVRDLNMRGIPTIPTIREANFYDDKAQQLPILRPWMPKTYHIINEDDAIELAETLEYPIISKAVDGSSSKTVRILNTLAEAEREVTKVFNGGIPSVYDRMQQDYVYWQEIVPDNDCDYRVVVIGGYVYGLVRNNKKDTIFASGSGDNYPITMKNSRERAAMARGVEIANAINTQWMAFDFVFDGDNPLVLEMSSAWTMKAYDKCPMYSRDGLHTTQRFGSASFDVAVEVCEAIWNEGVF
jgi:glutathione synthase/RimK-type ligase-like ATP-grasp enzyme